jgi:hypothetical protein
MIMDLSLSLALAALVALLGIGAHSWWSTRRARPRQADPLATLRQMSPARREPSLDGPSEPVEAGLDAGQASSEGDPGAAAPAGTDPFQLPVGRPAGARQGTRLDALIDVIVTLPVDAPVSGEIAVAHLPPSRRAGHKPLIIEGLNAESGDWETPVHGQRYSEFQAGVQLANRVGPLNQIEYSEFVQKVQAFAEAVGSMADFPDMLEVVARSRELDAFASPRDLQLAVGLRARAVPWSVGYVQQCGARHGFLPGAVPGRLVLPGAGEGDPPVLVLSFDPQAALSDDPQSAVVQEVQISLDVAQTPREAEPFPLWHRTSRLLAAEMEAAVVDDQGMELTLHAFDGIAKDLDRLYDALEARGLAAGSAVARRLFS